MEGTVTPRAVRLVRAARAARLAEGKGRAGGTARRAVPGRFVVAGEDRGTLPRGRGVGMAGKAGTVRRVLGWVAEAPGCERVRPVVAPDRDVDRAVGGWVGAGLVAGAGVPGARLVGAELVRMVRLGRAGCGKPGA